MHLTQAEWIDLLEEDRRGRVRWQNPKMSANLRAAPQEGKSRPPPPIIQDALGGAAPPQGNAAAGWRIAVWWKDDACFYRGAVQGFDPESGAIATPQPNMVRRRSKLPFPVLDHIKRPHEPAGGTAVNATTLIELHCAMFQVATRCFTTMGRSSFCCLLRSMSGGNGSQRATAQLLDRLLSHRPSHPQRQEQRSRTPKSLKQLVPR